MNDKFLLFALMCHAVALLYMVYQVYILRKTIDSCDGQIRTDVNEVFESICTALENHHRAILLLRKMIDRNSKGLPGNRKVHD